MDTVAVDARASTSSTILYFDGKTRYFRDSARSGTQSSRCVDSRTVEILRECATGVRRVSLDGRFTAVVAGGTGVLGDGGDGGPATSAALKAPTTVALDRDRNLYIGHADRVRKVTLDGIINTVAGRGKDSPGDDGPATNAQIQVESIAIDSSGNLYIAGYGRVRKVSANGTITTVGRKWQVMWSHGITRR